MSDSASDTMNLFGIVRSLGDIRNTTNGSKFPRNATIMTKSMTKVPITIIEDMCLLTLDRGQVFSIFYVFVNEIQRPFCTWTPSIQFLTWRQ